MDQINLITARTYPRSVPVCRMEPCQITEVIINEACGVDIDNLVARNYLRDVAVGTAAYADYGRRLVLQLKKVAEGNGDGYQIKDESVLRKFARLYKLSEIGRSKEEVALELAKLFLNEFTSQAEFLQTLTLAPEKRHSLWEARQVLPFGIDRTVVDAIQLSHTGVNQDYRDLLIQAFRTSLAGGWGGARIADMVSNILFGSPVSNDNTGPPLNTGGPLSNENAGGPLSNDNTEGPLEAGLSVAAIKYILGGTYRASLRPLIDAIIQGRIKGIAALLCCNLPDSKNVEYINNLTKGLLKEDVLVLKTGCPANASLKAGMLTGAAVLKEAGDGLREVCEAVNMPPVLDMGNCIAGTRILEAATEIVLEAGLDDLSQLPLVGVTSNSLREQVTVLGSYWVASGIDFMLGQSSVISRSENVTHFLSEATKSLFGGAFHVCEAPGQTVATIMKIINEAREGLGINKQMERKLFDMKDRREAGV